MSLIKHYKRSLKSLRSKHPKAYDIAVGISSYIYRQTNLKTKIRGKCNILIVNNVFFKNVRLYIYGNGNTVTVGPESYLCNSVIRISGSGHRIMIGRKAKLFDTVLWMEDQNNIIEIGDDTSINGAHIAVTEPHHRISIGENCLFSSEIDVRNGDSHSIIDIDTNQRINYACDIIVGNHVWIGKYVKIIKGAHIEDDSVIGIGSLVNSRITRNSIAVGIPAKIVKNNINWTHTRIYENESSVSN